MKNIIFSLRLVLWTILVVSTLIGIVPIICGMGPVILNNIAALILLAAVAYYIYNLYKYENNSIPQDYRLYTTALIIVVAFNLCYLISGIGFVINY